MKQIVILGAGTAAMILVGNVAQKAFRGDQFPYAMRMVVIIFVIAAPLAEIFNIQRTASRLDIPCNLER